MIINQQAAPSGGTWEDVSAGVEYTGDYDCEIYAVTDGFTVMLSAYIIVTDGGQDLGIIDLSGLDCAPPGWMMEDGNHYAIINSGDDCTPPESAQLYGSAFYLIVDNEYHEGVIVSFAYPVA